MIGPAMVNRSSGASAPSHCSVAVAAFNEPGEEVLSSLSPGRVAFSVDKPALNPIEYLLRDDRLELVRVYDRLGGDRLVALPSRYDLAVPHGEILAGVSRTIDKRSSILPPLEDRSDRRDPPDLASGRRHLATVEVRRYASERGSRFEILPKNPSDDLCLVIQRRVDRNDRNDLDPNIE